MNVMTLATSAATPATIMTALAKRSPVPRGSPSEAACRRRLPGDMVVTTQSGVLSRSVGADVRRIPSTTGKSSSNMAWQKLNSTSLECLVPKVGCVAGGAMRRELRPARGITGSAWGCRRLNLAILYASSPPDRLGNRLVARRFPAGTLSLGCPEHLSIARPDLRQHARSRATMRSRTRRLPALPCNRPPWQAQSYQSPWIRNAASIGT